MIKIMKWFFRFMLILLIVCALLLGYARYIAPYRLTTTSFTIHTQMLAGSETKVKIAIFADTHFSDYYTLEHFKKVQAAINEQSPDIILFCGDLIDYFDQYDGDIREISAALAQLTAPMGKFAIYGNHDYGGGAQFEYTNIMEAGGFQVLVNERLDLGETGISLIGLDDFVIGHGDIGVIKKASADRFNIVLCHEPDIVDKLLEDPVDLMTAGHTHGGQIHIPGYIKGFLPPYGEKYLKGAFDFENERQTKLYVNSGIGMTKLPLRFMAPPEVTFITISK